MVKIEAAEGEICWHLGPKIIVSKSRPRPSLDNPDNIIRVYFLRLEKKKAPPATRPLYVKLVEFPFMFKARQFG